MGNDQYTGPSTQPGRFPPSPLGGRDDYGRASARNPQIAHGCLCWSSFGDNGRAAPGTSRDLRIFESSVDGVQRKSCFRPLRGGMSEKRKPARSFTDLIVCQKADTLSGKIYAVTETFPKEERYRLIDQMRTAA